MSQNKSGLNPSSKKYKELKEAFDFFDKNNSGSIDPKEINTVLNQLGTKSTETEISDMMTSIDKNNDNAVSFDEFCVMIKASSKFELKQDAQDEIREQFKLFDLDGNGSISPDELKKVMATMGEKISDEEIDDLLAKYDLNKNGFIEYNEFVKYMCDEV